ncbi:hypothetical protein CDCA_CDCA01G0023 [Cyanidium caldarium]|uniref:Nucleolar GTP-binding protein 2 n=1 Tax=Cyanidium caldarium TaxID=2771 RepID=A0AAV9IP37_CYACA|nr:hypothetical protein CDCA_CDCA01G0023 [Cyanidium caldarium]
MPKLRVRVAPGVNGHVPASSTDVNRGNRKLAGGGRDRATVQRLKMYARRAYVRNRDGQVLRDRGDYTSNVPQVPDAGRVAPNRRWFGNTRTVDAEALRVFREHMARVSADPFAVVVKRRKLPLGLLKEGMNPEERAHYERCVDGPAASSSSSAAPPDGAARGLLRIEPFAETFSKTRRRKRPRALTSSVADMANRVQGLYEKDGVDAPSPSATSLWSTAVAGGDTATSTALDKGQSRRIWNELHKVIDSSDVVVQVLDARDPLGTRSPFIERFLKRDRPHKHLVLVLNKSDLVPKAVTARWLQLLSREYPTVAFQAADLKKPFGRGALIQLLRQYAKILCTQHQSISCGVVGYPNVGKSSIINALRKKKVVRAAPIPGETKVWQYVTLMRRVYLVDCPGVVHVSAAQQVDADDLVLRGVVRIESLRDDAQRYIPQVLQRVQRAHLERAYQVRWIGDSAEAFLEALARYRGKLLSGGEPDSNAVAKTVLADYIRGRLPWFVPPPTLPEKERGEAPEIVAPSELPVESVASDTETTDPFAGLEYPDEEELGGVSASDADQDDGSESDALQAPAQRFSNRSGIHKRAPRARTPSQRSQRRERWESTADLQANLRRIERRHSRPNPPAT